MTNQQSTENNQIREFIVEIVNTKKPETTNALVKLVQQKYPMTIEEIKEILMQLEEENKIHFTKKTSPAPSTLSAYMFSHNSIWFWITAAIAISTAAAVFLIPENDYPLTYLRQTVGTIFVLLLPGFVFLKTLYPAKIPIATSSENLDTVERIALSIGLSIALVAIDGLILNYTPWGIRLAPVTLSLFVLTLVFAVVGVFRQYQAKTMQLLSF
jgi:hypothetical protein